MRNYRPAIFFHPGETLAEKLEEMQMSAGALANATGVPVMVINGIISGDLSVSADLALAFEQTTGIPADYWVRAQHEYDNPAPPTPTGSYSPLTEGDVGTPGPPNPRTSAP